LEGGKGERGLYSLWIYALCFFNIFIYRLCINNIDISIPIPISKGIGKEPWETAGALLLGATLGQGG